MMASGKRHETREELNKKAASLLALAQKRLATSHAPQEEACVLEELRTDCQRLKKELQELKKKCSELPPPPRARSREQGSCEEGSRDLVADLLVEEVGLRAELAVLQGQRRTEGVSTHDAVLQAMTHHQVCESCQQLNQLIQTLRNERKRIRNDLKSEKALLGESRELLEALEKKVAGFEDTTDRQTHHSAEEELKEKIALVNDSIKSLQENLVQFCTEEILQPTDEPESERGKRKKKKGEQERVDTLLLRKRREAGEEESDQFTSLPATVKELVLKAVHSPHSPYLPLASIWPPHRHLLQRSGVIQNHPDNPSLVRVTPFHL